GCADGTVVVAPSDRLADSIRFATGAEAVNDVAFDATGTRIAVATTTAGALVFDARTGTRLVALPCVEDGTSRSAPSVASTPDGGRVLATYDGGASRIWTSDGAPLHDLEPHRQQHNSWRVAFGGAFSADGRWVVTCGNDECGRVHDAATGRRVGFL